MDNFFKDSGIPGGNILKWILVSLVVIPLMISFMSDNSATLTTLLKILVVIFDAVCLYIVMWILRKKMFDRYKQNVLAIAVLTIGETMMAYL